MSLLAPLYLLGALAVIGPIIVHLIRRQPKGEVEFSSLMFLDPTPPRLTRRSRLENLPLLLLRCAAILLLAFAFARPFLPLSESTSAGGVTRAMVLLIDRSASMQRTGLWDQTVARAEAMIEQADADTLISVVAFDASPKTLLSLQASSELDAEGRKSAARDAIADLAPTWFSTDLGAAVRYAADQAASIDIGASVRQKNAETDETTSSTIETQIVLLSDMQAGAPIESLQGYSWPQRVWLDIQSVTSDAAGNATLQVLPQAVTRESDNESDGPHQTLRVAITQTDDAQDSTVRLRLAGHREDLAVAQVPPGTTRIVSVSLPSQTLPSQTLPSQTLPSQTLPSQTLPSESLPPESLPDAANTASSRGTQATGNPHDNAPTKLLLLGDRHEFDNAYHFIRPRRMEQSIWFLDAPANDESGGRQDRSPASVRETLDFYASQVPWSNSSRLITFRTVTSERFSPPPDPANTPLILLRSSPLISQLAESIESYLNRGGRVLVIVDREVDELTTQALARLFRSESLKLELGEGDDYRLISSVDFKSELIRPLSEPGVNDFSNLRVWTHQRATGLSDDVSITLKLDDGSPLLIRRDVGNAESGQTEGRIWMLTTGWQPSQSQFALSTKFVPLMLGMLGKNRQLTPSAMVVGDRYATGDGDASQIATEPGFVVDGDGQRIAVNLSVSESNTEPLDLDRLAEYGAVVSTPKMRAQDASAERALRDVELEARQGWWQWLILATLGLIAAETLLAATQSPQKETSP